MLAETAQNLGIAKMCIAGGESRYGLAGNEHVVAQSHRYPELFVPFGYVRLGEDGAREVEELRANGFMGLRVAAPPARWDAPEFFPLYEAAAALNMPVLFHTRILPRTPVDKAVNIGADYSRPIYLDKLARQIPSLKIVGTGLGVPWSDEAAELLAVHDNIFFDLSGNILARKGTDFFTSLLGGRTGVVWGEGGDISVWTRVVFGTGVPYDKIASVERDYERLFRALGLSEDVSEKVMGGNAARLLGLKERR
jgi:predicted TIM-barrel fold metal-dependent hydrolase